MEIKYINHNTFDAFHGKGWEGWGRFKIAYRKEGTQLFQIPGVHFPENLKAKLKEKITNNNHE